MTKRPFQSHSLSRFIRQRQLIEEGFVAFSPATLWRRVADKTFPAPVKLSAGVTAWREADVMEWQRKQAVAHNGGAAK